MKRPGFHNLLSPAAWGIVVLLALAALVFAWWVFTAPQRAAAAKAGQTIAEGHTKGAADAVGINDKARTTAQQSEDLTRENADAIRQAPGADVRLDPDLNRTGRERLCNRPAYAGRPECLQHAGGAQPSR
jgi:hypothetical protein